MLEAKGPFLNFNDEERGEYEIPAREGSTWKLRRGGRGVSKHGMGGGGGILEGSSRKRGKDFLIGYK